MEYLLGIDIGTSSCKAALFQPDGTVVAKKSRGYPVLRPHAGWAEQNPDDWWDAVASAVGEILRESQTNPRQIAGIGVAGQSWAAVAVDRQGEVLCNTPIWMDTRATAECAALKKSVGEEKLFELCGNPLQPTYTYPKILWMKNHLPETYKSTERILQSNSFIVYRLTGCFSQDLSQGYGLFCFDMKKGSWSRDICEETGVNAALLPEIYPCHAVVGKVTADAARTTGLAEGTPVVAGGLDAALSALGAGVIHSGEAQEQGGQAGGLSICMDSFHAERRLILGRHVVPGKWLLQGGTVGGGGVLRWFEKEFFAAERASAAASGTTGFAKMDREAETIPAGSEGLVFLPYMAGERSPIWDENAKGIYFGLDYTKTRAHLIRACMEGVAFSLLHNLRTAESAGARIKEFRAVGGSAQSKLWTQIKADVTGEKILVPEAETATALGAAMLAGVGVGVYPDFETAVSRTVRITREHRPDKAVRAAYDHNFKIYLELYERLKDCMEDLPRTVHMENRK